MQFKPQLFFLNLISVLFISCGPPPENIPQSPFLMVLGIAQDAGFPQAGCQKECCRAVWEGKSEQKMVSCLALVDPQNNQFWMFDATPDFRFQLQKVKDLLPDIQLSGIFLTHAHIGHYTGLMQLGREVIGANQIPVFAMPRMKSFLETNGPWSQLIGLKNIEIHPLKADSTIILNSKFQITPLPVPHRDEYSETAGFSIAFNQKKALFIPDIDKWQLWDRSIAAQINQHDIAFLDGTFYENGEIPGRDMSEIPHPFIVESMEAFKTFSETEKAKVHFIHFNHTNPVFNKKSEAHQNVLRQGFNLAEEGFIFTF